MAETVAAQFTARSDAHETEMLEATRGTMMLHAALWKKLAVDRMLLGQEAMWRQLMARAPVNTDAEFEKVPEGVKEEIMGLAARAAMYARARAEEYNGNQVVGGMTITGPVDLLKWLQIFTSAGFVMYKEERPHPNEFRWTGTPLPRDSFAINADYNKFFDAAQLHGPTLFGERFDLASLKTLTPTDVTEHMFPSGEVAGTTRESTA